MVGMFLVIILGIRGEIFAGPGSVPLILYTKIWYQGGYSDVKIAGINGLDYIEGEISGMIQNRVLPWAQDNEDSHVWDTWNITLRDFIVLDINGDFFYKINLTDVDPSIESNYENLKQLLLDARSN